MGIQHSWMDWLWGVLEQTHTELPLDLKSTRGLGAYGGRGVISDRVLPGGSRVRMKVRVFRGLDGVVVTAGQAFQADNKRDRRKWGTHVPSLGEVVEAVHDALRKLLDVVKEVQSLFPGEPVELALPGGGDVPIPRWMIDELRELGVTLHLLGEEEHGGTSASASSSDRPHWMDR